MHCQLFMNQYSQVLHPVLISETALTWVQVLVLGTIEYYRAHTDLFLKLVKLSLDDIPFLRHIRHTTQLDVLCKLAEGALDLAYVIDKDTKCYWSQYRQVRDTTGHQSLRGHKATVFLNIIYCSREQREKMRGFFKS